MKKGLFGLIVVLLFLSFFSLARAENKNVVEIGGDVTIAEGQKIKNVVAVGGQITVNGTVTGHVVAIGRSVVLTRSALVEGNVISVGGVVVMGRGAIVHGNIKEINASDFSASVASALDEDWEGWSWVFAVLSFLIFIGVLILATLLVILLPKPIYLVSTAIKESPFRVFLWGLLVLVSIAPLAILLTISVLGIVLIPLEMAMVVCSALVGFTAAAQITGEKIFSLLKKRDQSVIIDVLWGLIFLWLVGWIPHFGWMVKVIAVVLGLGGVLVACLGATKKWKKVHQISEGGTDGGGTAIS
jgi:hypothetical protein